MMIDPFAPWRGMSRGDSELVNVGKWQLRSERDELIVDGQYEKDVPHGEWTTYHANGRLASHGNMSFGAKNGTWRAWDDEGRPLSEIVYSAVKIQRQIGGMGMPPRSVDGYVSQRHGPVRAWHLNGELKLEGQYLHGLRHGPWTLHNEHGHVTAKGQYRADKRDGLWTLCDESGIGHPDCSGQIRRSTLRSDP